MMIVELFGQGVSNELAVFFIWIEEKKVNNLHMEYNYVHVIDQCFNYLP